MNVLTLGSFDLMHPGHVGLFQTCRDLAGNGTVTVAVNSDQFMTEYKRAPILNQDERLALVAACRHVDVTVLNDGTNQAALIAAVNPDLIVIGSDWATRDYLGQLGITQEFLDLHHIGVAYVPRTGDWSTTELRERL